MMVALGTIAGLAFGALMLAHELAVKRADKRRLRWPG